MSGPNAPPINGMMGRNAAAAMKQFMPLASDVAQYGGPAGGPAMASSAPRPTAPPVRAPQVPTPVPEPQAPAQIPLPRPRPVGANDIPPDDFKRQVIELEAKKAQAQANQPPVRAGAPVTSPEDFLQKLQQLEASKGTNQPPFPAPLPQAQSQAPVPAPTLPQVTQKDVAQAMVPKSADRPPTDAQPQTPAPDPTKMKFSYQQPRPGDVQQGTDFPRAVPKSWYMTLTNNEAPVRASIPAQILDRAMRAAREGKKFAVPQLPEKTKTNEEAKAGNMYFYQALGVTPGDKQGAAHAIAKLQQKAISAPWELTPFEDKILASASKSEGFHQSMEPGAVAARRAEYEKKGDQAGLRVPDTGETTMQFTPPKFDPAATMVQNFIASKGTPPMQGKPGAPTQQDINNGAPKPTAPEEEEVPED